MEWIVGASVSFVGATVRALRGFSLDCLSPVASRVQNTVGTGTEDESIVVMDFTQALGVL